MLVTDEKGRVLSKKAIAGTFFDENQLIKSVASINEDGLIQVVIGSDQGQKEYYDPLNSQVINYEIAPDGELLMITNNDEE